MEEKSLFEKMGGTHRKAGDYFIPNIEAPENDRPIGIWGQRHLDYIRRHNKVLLNELQLSFKLHDYLADINEQAQDMYDTLVKQLVESEGITEQLKIDNQMEWVRRMNNIGDRAQEIVNNELIYA